MALSSVEKARALLQKRSVVFLELSVGAGETMAEMISELRGMNCRVIECSDGQSVIAIPSHVYLREGSLPGLG